MLSRTQLLAAILIGGAIAVASIAALSLTSSVRALWVLNLIVFGSGFLAMLASIFLSLPMLSKIRQRFPEESNRSRKIGLFLGVILLGGFGAVLLYNFGFQSLKFHYMTNRVESARTSNEERAAFDLANRWGRVWELNRLQRKDWLPERAQHLKGDWVLELEWLESSAWNGQPFRAYRVVLDEKNLEVFRRKGKAL